MPKIDFKKELRELYNPPKKFVIVDVPVFQFLMVDGHGDPNLVQEYQDAIEVLYAVAYKQKFICKKISGVDYVVPPLEGLWWADDMDAFGISLDKSQWDWTMMIMTPDCVTYDMFSDAVMQVGKSKNPAALSKIRLDRYHEGFSVQILYFGAYADEGQTIVAMHQFIGEKGLIPNGKHHEIYLGDPRRTPPEKLKTILRQPVRLR
jgi:hypothetical protein